MACKFTLIVRDGPESRGLDGFTYVRDELVKHLRYDWGLDIEASHIQEDNYVWCDSCGERFRPDDLLLELPGYCCGVELVNRNSD